MVDCMHAREKESLTFVVFCLLAAIALVYFDVGIDKDAIAQNSEFNISNLPSDKDMSFSKLLSSVRMISGTYTNSDLGFTIVFPTGWNGSEISYGLGKSASVISPESFETGIPSAIGVTFIDNRNGSALSAISNATDMFTNPSTSRNGSSSEGPQCKSTEVSNVILNGINAEQRVFECQNLANMIGGNATVKSYTLVTNDDSLVSISLFGAKENYEKNLPIFEDAVKTIKLSNRGDISNSPTFNAYKNALDSETK
jgi:hypothetical protein